MYANYDYYTNTFGGSLIPDEANFNRSVKMAGRYIDQFTFCRILPENEGDIDGLKDCACDMAESIYKALYANPGGEKEKRSENIDGYSVSYVTEQKDGESNRASLSRKLYDIARLYLVHTGLMYLGVDKCSLTRI